MAKFSMTPALAAILAGIHSGATTHVAKTAEIGALVGEGYITVNPAVLDASGNAAVSLTEKGTAAVPAPVGTVATSTSLFALATSVELPPIKRGGNTTERSSKYPLKDIVLMGGLFIPAAEGRNPKTMSKQFGSMVADFNKENPDKYLTSRTVEDGKAAGFIGVNADGTPNPEAFAGKPGIGIYSRPVSERKERKPRAAAAAATA